MQSERWWATYNTSIFWTKLGILEQKLKTEFSDFFEIFGIFGTMFLFLGKILNGKIPLIPQANVRNRLKNAKLPEWLSPTLNRIPRQSRRWRATQKFDSNADKPTLISVKGCQLRAGKNLHPKRRQCFHPGAQRHVEVWPFSFFVSPWRECQKWVKIRSPEENYSMKINCNRYFKENISDYRKIIRWKITLTLCWEWRRRRRMQGRERRWRNRRRVTSATILPKNHTKISRNIVKY